MKEQSPRPQTQGLTGGQITENAVNIIEPTQVPKLKPKELQAIQLLHQAREEGKEIYKRGLTDHLYPEDNFQIASIKARGDLRGANRKLRHFGWRIDHPLHYSQGKVRKIIDRYVILRQDEILEAQSSKSGKEREVIKKPPIHSIPMLPHTQDTKLLPTSATAWESLQAKEEKIKKERLEQLRQDIVLFFTLAFLSHVKTDNIKKLTRNPTKNWFGQIPKEFSFDSVFGTHPKEDEETKDRKNREFLVKGLCETVDRLWEVESNTVTTPKEKQIVTMCGELKQKGIDKDMVKNIAGEHYGVEIPDKSEAAVV